MLAAGATFEAEAGSFDGVLTLENVNNQTLAFSDRPERIAGTVPTLVFVLRSASESSSSEFYFEVDVLYANHLEESLTCGGPVRSVVLAARPSATCAAATDT